jgi:hypothetical protein
MVLSLHDPLIDNGTLVGFSIIVGRGLVALMPQLYFGSVNEAINTPAACYSPFTYLSKNAMVRCMTVPQLLSRL